MPRERRSSRRLIVGDVTSSERLARGPVTNTIGISPSGPARRLLLFGPKAESYAV